MLDWSHRHGERRVLSAFLAAFLILLAGVVHRRRGHRRPRPAHRHPRPPQRIVSLMPSLTETVCALGACARLVGVDDYSTWPAAVNALPHVAGMEDARLETIVGLKPDLILAPTSSRALPRLRALGLPVLALEPRTLRDVRRVLQALGPVLAAGDPEQVWLKINRQVQEAALRLPAGRRGTRVYVEVSSTPYAASDGVLHRRAAAAPGPGEHRAGLARPFPKLNPEFVVRAIRGDHRGARRRGLAAHAPGLEPHRRAAHGPGLRARARPDRRADARGPAAGRGAQLLVDCLGARRPRGAPADDRRTARAGRAGGVAAGRQRGVLLALGIAVGSMGWEPLLDESGAGLTILWEIRLPRTVGALDRGRAAGPVRRGGAGPVPQSAGRSLPARKLHRRRAGRRPAAGAAGRAAPAATRLASSLGMTGAAFVGAVFAVMLTLALARGVQHTLRLLLAGVIVGMVFGALSSLVIFLAPELLRSMQSFLLGTTGFLGWASAGVLALRAARLCRRGAGLGAARSMRWRSGETTAASLGVPLARVRLGWSA
jgi:iron complex transport system substrate-binding protein